MADVTKEVGFRLTVEGSDLKDEVDDTKKSVKGLGDENKKTEKKGKSAMETLRGGLDIVFKATEIAKSAYEVLNSTIGESIRTAIDFRRANDPIVLWFNRVRDESDRLRARIGDALLPVIKGFTDAIFDTRGGLSDWVKENRKLIGTNLTKWIGTTAKILVKVLGTAILFIVRAWKGWELVIDSVKAAWFGAVTGMADITKDLLIAMAELSLSLGDKRLAGKYGKMIMLTGKFGESSAEAADKAILAAQETAAELAETEKSILSLQDTVTRAIDKGMVNAFRNVKKSVAGLAFSLERTNAMLMKWLTDIEKMANAQNRFNQAVRDLDFGNLERLADIEAKELVTLEKRRDLLAEMGADTGFFGALAAMGHQFEILNYEMERGMITVQEFQDAVFDMTKPLVDAFAAAGNEFGTLLGAVVAGQITMDQAMASVAQSMMINILTFVENAILAFAAQAAAAQIAAHAFLPFVGIAIGAAAGATIFGLIKALIGQVPTGMKMGGEVSGGTQGQDSVLALLTPGERVFTVDENKMLKRLMRSVGSPRSTKEKAASGPGFQTGGTVGQPTAASAPSRRGQTNVNIRMDLLSVPDAAQRKQALLGVARDLEELFDDGMILRNAKRIR